ncbi:MAG: roadblock/LC7 domain-containing protein [Candidatus Zixiibacteriota bacterium]
MKNVLAKINQLPGVIGSTLVAEDGIVIVSDLAVAVQDEIVGAMISAIGVSTVKAIKRLDHGNFELLVVEAKNGKLFISLTNKGFLGVLSENDVNIGLIRIEIVEAAKAINKLKY